MLLGNDVVDLRGPGADRKPEDQRFLDRVFTSEEQMRIAEGRSPALALWMLWSAKESLFKIAQRLDPAALFSHRDFCLDKETAHAISRCAPDFGALERAITWNRIELTICWEWNEEYVHCVAGECPWICRVEAMKPDSEERDSLSADEMKSVHSLESCEVRRLAKRLLREGQILENLEIIRPRLESRFLAPVLYLNGKPAPRLNPSLSHDGRFVAAAVPRLV